MTCWAREKAPGRHRVERQHGTGSTGAPRSARMVNHELLKDKIVGQLPLGTAYPELTKHALVCVTETSTRKQIEDFAAAVQAALAEPL